MRRDHITLEDLKHFLPTEKAVAALKVLDADADGKVSLHDMRDAVLQIYKVYQVAFRNRVQELLAFYVFEPNV